MEIDDLSRSELEAFFPGSKYPDKFLSYKDNESRFAGFNFWAALFSTSWFFYRRLYAQGLVALILEILVPAIIILLAFPLVSPSNEFEFRLVPAISVVVVRIAIGYWANLVMFKDAERQIREIDTMNFNNDMYLQVIAGAGAVNIPAFIWSFAIIGVIDGLLWSGLV